MGGIVGGVIGGLAALAILGAGFRYYRRRRLMVMGDTGAGIVGPYSRDRAQEQTMATTSGIGGGYVGH